MTPEEREAFEELENNRAEKATCYGDLKEHFCEEPDPDEEGHGCDLCGTCDLDAFDFTTCVEHDFDICHLCRDKQIEEFSYGGFKCLTCKTRCNVYFSEQEYPCDKCGSLNDEDIHYYQCPVDGLVFCQEEVNNVAKGEDDEFEESKS